MYCIDANSFITGWQVYYPTSVFPSLWDKIAAQQANLIIIKPIYDEIEFLSSNNMQKPLPELAKIRPIKAWLLQQNFQAVKIENNVDSLSLELERKYEISPNRKGASKNDITLIAHAKTHNIPVVTFEGKQSNRPGEKYNYKIPLICQDENVECIILPECLKRLGITI